jgi:hypothetical protein
MGDENPSTSGWIQRPEIRDGGSDISTAKDRRDDGNVLIANQF